VVWTDSNNVNQIDIYGTRVTRAGGVRDPLGLPISTAPGVQMSPAVATDGSVYIVAWQDFRNGATSDIFAARVDTLGTVADTFGFPVSLKPMSQISPSLAFGDSNYLVAWEDMRSDPNGDIYCARVAADARVLDSAGFVVTAAAGHQVSPKVAFDGASYLLVWADSRSGASAVYGARVAQSGVLLDTAGIPVCLAQDHQGNPGIAFGDTNFLAVWDGYRYGEDSEIYGARINRAGRVLDGNGRIFSTEGSLGSQLVPCGAFLDSSYLVAWEQQLQVHFTRVTQDGVLLDSASRALDQSQPREGTTAIAAAESCAFVVWADDHGIVAGARIARSGEILDSTEAIVVNHWVWPDWTSVAGNGQDWLVVYNGDFGDVWATRVSSAGLVLDTSGILVSGAAGRAYWGHVATGDSDYLVVWNKVGGDIFAARVTRSGTVLDSAGIRVTFDTANRQAARVASGDIGYLVVWKAVSNTGLHDVCGARLNPSGVAIDSEPILIAGGFYYCESPSVGFDGRDYTVAWSHRDGPNQSGKIHGARVSPWGTVLATFPLSQQERDHGAIGLINGPGSQMLALYDVQTDSVNHQPVNVHRIWGRLSPFVGIEEEGLACPARRMALDILPNPLSGVGEVRYALPTNAHVRLAVYDISGRLVHLLAGEQQKAGNHMLRWNGTAKDGTSLTNGVYILRLDAAVHRETRTLIIAR
jgi:hypothetical protein